MMPPAFFDDGEAGTWLDMIYHSPRLKVSEHTRDDGAQLLAPSAPHHLSLHASLTTDERERNHGVR